MLSFLRKSPAFLGRMWTCTCWRYKRKKKNVFNSPSVFWLDSDALWKANYPPQVLTGLFFRRGWWSLSETTSEICCEWRNTKQEGYKLVACETLREMSVCITGSVESCVTVSLGCSQPGLWNDSVSSETVVMTVTLKLTREKDWSRENWINSRGIGEKRK